MVTYKTESVVELLKCFSTVDHESPVIVIDLMLSMDRVLEFWQALFLNSTKLREMFGD